MRDLFHARRGGEIGIPVALFVLALLLRGWGLGLRPAAPGEAAQAWAAWRGEGVPPGGSPALASWNAIAFAIFGPDDGWMRSGAALAGALTVLALWALLRPAGRAGAIGAAWLWAVSPTALMAARSLDGGAVAAMALAAFLALRRAPHPYRWIGWGIALGVGAAAGPAFWTAAWIALPLLWLEPPEPAFPRWPMFGLAGLTAVMVSTGGGWRAGGVREMVEGLSGWLAGFAPEGLPLWAQALGAFLRGEAVILGLGGLGAILAVGRRDRFGIALAIGAGIGIGLGLIRFHAPFTEHAVWLVPWAALAGYALQGIWEAVEPVWRSRRTAVLGVAAIGGVGAGTMAVVLGERAGAGEARGWILVGVLALLGLGGWLLEIALEPETEGGQPDPAEAGRRPAPLPGGLRIGSGIRSPVALGIIGVIAFTAGLGQLAGAAALIRRVDPVPGFSFPVMAAPAVRDVVEELRREAARRSGWPGGLSVVVVSEENEAFWRWTLRGFRLTVRARPPASAEGDVWIAPEEASVPLPGDQWVGRAFPALVDVSGETPMERRMIVWVRVP